MDSPGLSTSGCGGDRKEDRRKQRHTAKRIFERLRDEHDFTGGYTIVKDYVREHHRRRREMYVPLVHPPGHGQADFGEAWAFIGGVKQKVPFLRLRPAAQRRIVRSGISRGDGRGMGRWARARVLVLRHGAVVDSLRQRPVPGVADRA